MKNMSLLQLLLYVVLLTVSFAWSATGHVAVRADLTHIDSGRGFTKRDLLRRMAARTRARVDKRWTPPRRPGGANDNSTVTATVSRGTVGKNHRDSEYLIHFSIGTPRPQPVALTLDTGTDLVWTQCGCMSCFHQPFADLDTSASTTHRHVPCSDRVCTWGGLPLSGCTVNDNFCFYVYPSGDDSFTTGKISEDTFAFQTPTGKAVPVPSLRFGCGMYNTGNFKSNETGVAGFGRGPMSLPVQLKVRRFSYCFTTILESGNSPVFLGTSDNLTAQATGQIQSTPFVRTPAGPASSLYYLSLKGVTVGNTRLPFNASTFALKGDGNGGTIIDSGTGITSFPRAVFRTLREEFISQVSLPVTDESAADDDSMLCFSIPRDQNAPVVPNLTLHLEGADWDLPRESYVLDVDDDDKGTGRGFCVVINSAGDSRMTVIGNFQQQNMHIVYDLEGNKLVFVTALCDRL